ncbi:hypothetical protein ACLIYM_06805 [Streptomyces fenghuangensis]
MSGDWGAVLLIAAASAFLALAVWEALAASSVWVWCEPLGVAVMGAGLAWWRHPLPLVLGAILTGVGGGIAQAHRWGALPRRSRPPRYGLPPL